MGFVCSLPLLINHIAIPMRQSTNKRFFCLKAKQEITSNFNISSWVLNDFFLIFSLFGLNLTVCTKHTCFWALDRIAIACCFQFVTNSLEFEWKIDEKMLLLRLAFNLTYFRLCTFEYKTFKIVLMKSNRYPSIRIPLVLCWCLSKWFFVLHFIFDFRFECQRYHCLTA